MLSEYGIQMKNVWKKYSKGTIFHNNLREDMIDFFTKRKQDGLSKDEFWVLKDFNLEMKKSESVGLYGPNGTGKSTILKLIANVTYPDKGEITINGKVAPLIEVGAGFHPDLTGRENVFMNGAILGMTISEIKLRMDKIIEFSGIRDFVNMPVKKYSSGMYLRLAFSVAIHSEADIYLFDEILAVGDKDFREKCFAEIDKLKNNGKTMIIVSHSHKTLEKFADSIIEMKSI